MTTTFFDLIRHGEPAGGHKYRGHRDDPLSELGWQQMRDAIGQHEQWDHISSPLLRREFARELSEQRNIPVTVAGFQGNQFWRLRVREQVAREYGDHQANFGAMQKIFRLRMRKSFRIFITASAQPGNTGVTHWQESTCYWSATAASFNGAGACAYSPPATPWRASRFRLPAAHRCALMTHRTAPPSCLVRL